MSNSHPVPLLSFVAASGTGKTTLLTRLIPILRDRGLRCAAIKHSHHDVDVDIPGKDSHRLRLAGAQQVLLASPYRTFWIEEGDGTTEPDFDQLVARLDHSVLDIVLVEGFRQAHLPKIEVHRAQRGTALLCSGDDEIIALAADIDPRGRPSGVPLLPLNAPDAIASFVVKWLASSVSQDQT